MTNLLENPPNTWTLHQDSAREVENQLRTVKLMIKCAQARRKVRDPGLPDAGGCRLPTIVANIR